MKKYLLSGTLALLAGSLLAADSTSKDRVTAAAEKLADKDNYAWKRTTEDAGGSRSGRRTSEGKVEKDGYLWLSMTLSMPQRSPGARAAIGENSIEGMRKGEKVAIKTTDGWQSFSEATSGGPSPASIGARLVQIVKAPAAEADELAGKVKELRKDGDVYVGELTEEAAQSQIITGSGRRPRGPRAPEMSGAKGSVKFSVKDGVLAKYEIKVQAKLKIMGNEIDVDRTITVDIEEVGSTKVPVPDEAMRKMS